MFPTAHFGGNIPISHVFGGRCPRAIDLTGDDCAAVTSWQPICRNFNAYEVLARILLIRIEKLLLPMGWRAARQTQMKHRRAEYTSREDVRDIVR
jgi:hypothetical protein